jgi:hypothetical protein
MGALCLRAVGLLDAAALANLSREALCKQIVSGRSGKKLSQTHTGLKGSREGNNDERDESNDGCEFHCRCLGCLGMNFVRLA